MPIINKLNSKHSFEAIMPVSALKKMEVDSLLSKIMKRFHLENFITQLKMKKSSKSFYISEIIREKAINRLGDELPYRINVEVEKIDEEKSIQHIHQHT